MKSQQAARFKSSCVNWPRDEVDELIEMCSEAKSITLETFRKKVDRDELQELEESLGYSTGRQRGGLRLSKDWHVSFHRSVYRGKPAYYLKHSAIEYVFQ